MRGRWVGTAGELLAELEAHHTDERTRKRRDWPGTPKSLGGALQRLAPNLRATGIDVVRYREPGGPRRRMIRIEQIGSSVSEQPRPAEQPDAVVQEAVLAGRKRDGGDDRASTNSPAGTPETGPSGPIRDGRDGRDGRNPHLSYEWTDV